ncbi:bacterial regulatory s, gntR family protein, partial [Vibrio parahaemolyticus VPTS-2010_2]
TRYKRHAKSTRLLTKKSGISRFFFLV